MESISVSNDVVPLVALIQRGDLKSVVDMKNADPLEFHKAIESYGSESMKYAVIHNHFQIAEYLLDNNCSCETGDDDPPILHHVATKSDASSFIQKLLETNVDVNEADLFDYTPLHWACESGVSRNVEIFLNAGAKSGIKNSRGETPLHLAVSNHHVDCVRLLLEAGAEVNVRIVHHRVNAYFWTPERTGRIALDFMLHDLFDAFSNCNPLEVLRALCSNPFSVKEVLFNLKSLAGPEESIKLSVNWDLIERQLEIIYLLLKYDDKLVYESSKKVDVPYTQIIEEFAATSNLAEKDEEGFSLIQSFRRTDFALAKALMKHSDDPHTMTSVLSSLLIDELKHCPSLKAVDLLLQLGADVSAQDPSYNRSTPLHLATNNYNAKHLNVKLLKILSKKANNIDIRDRDGYTPLMRAVQRGDKNCELIKLYLELNADTTLVNNDGATVWGVAMRQYNPNIVDFLMGCGLNFDMKKEFSYSNTLWSFVDMNIPNRRSELKTVRKFHYSDEIYKKRQLLVESFVRKNFPNCSSNLLDDLSCSCAELLRGSSVEHKFFCSISGEAATLYVAVESYLLRTHSISLSEYYLSQLLEYRLKISQPGNYIDRLQEEIDLMKSQIVWGSITLHQFIQSDADQLPVIFNNVDALDSILSFDSFEKSSYPIMGAIIKERWRDMIGRRNLLSAASSAVNSIFSSTMSPFSSFSTLPDHIIKQILSLLSKPELCNLILSQSGMTADLWSDLETLWWDQLNFLLKDDR